MSTPDNVAGDPPEEFVSVSEGNGRITRACRKNSFPPANFIAEGGKKQGRQRSKQKKLSSEDTDPIKKMVLIGNGNHGESEKETECLDTEGKQESVDPHVDLGKMLAAPGNGEVLASEQVMLSVKMEVVEATSDPKDVQAGSSSKVGIIKDILNRFLESDQE